MRPEWRTSTVVALCSEMRKTGDYSTTPMLADAMEDAGCDDGDLLSNLRSPDRSTVMRQYDVCLILGSRYETAARWLMDFCDNSDCPGYEDVVSAAIGVNIREGDDDYGMSGYYEAGLRDWGSLYLHFGGRDAHGEIPPEFWNHVETVTGKEIPDEQRAASFSCSC